MRTAAPIQPRFEPPAGAESQGSAGGPQARWVGFGRALMGLQRDPRRYTASECMRSRTIVVATPRTSLVVAVSPHTVADRAPHSTSSPSPSPGSAPRWTFASIGASLTAPGPKPAAPGVVPPPVVAARCGRWTLLGSPWIPRLAGRDPDAAARASATAGSSASEAGCGVSSSNSHAGATDAIRVTAAVPPVSRELPILGAWAAKYGAISGTSTFASTVSVAAWTGEEEKEDEER
jgi:hypothetical protein